ncbi:MAG: GIY-YIG nuclease family protein [Candidatus Uhrbacteria bacterium]|nr:GIY-YIG nuclease family protein [Patescibacteria group bacterium]MBU1907232.1 GIY-YIG nuclease family protein [Patescibacteria group bacterium]
MRSKRINLILHHGTPYGIKTAEMSNWNGKVVICPRQALKQLSDLDISDAPAVYLLFNREENLLYVGETDTLKARITHHTQTKDFWEELIACTSPELTKTEVKYLEHALHSRLQADGLVVLQNSVSPKTPTIRKEIQDAMDDFIDNVSDILLSLGFTFMGASAEVQRSAGTGIAVVCEGKDTEAYGTYSENGLLVRQGSVIRKAMTESTPDKYKQLQQTLLSKGLLSPNSEDSLIFREDHLFSSPSAAATMALGRSANGLAEWKTTEGVTIKDLDL